jgi:hypothetical protein
MHAIHALCELRPIASIPKGLDCILLLLAVDAGWVNSLQGSVVIAARLGSSFRTPHSVHLFCKHMPPGRPALVVVSLGLDHKRLYGVGMVQGASSQSGNCLLHSAIGSISSVLFAHPPDLAGALEAKV